ncbi:MAG: hypothetical protein H7Z75_04290 [Ferruginibacter sp.]|nr:hypothetical protein [Cytophagales bacterium]
MAGVGFGALRSDYGQAPAGSYRYQRLTAEARYYFRHDGSGLSSFYAGPYLRAARLRLNDCVFDQQDDFVRNDDGTFYTPVERAFVLTPSLLIGG